MELSLDLLRSFVAIVDCNSFTRAAEQLFRTQAAISQQIKKLEEQVGKPLLIRDKRSIRPTAEGESLLAYARQILHLEEEALSALTAPEITGRIRLGIPDDFAPRFLPGIMARFVRAYPQVQLEIHCDETAGLRRLLQKDEVDLAICTSVPNPEDGLLLRKEEVVWISSQRHRVHQENPVPLALFGPPCVIYEWATTALHKAQRAYRLLFRSASGAGIYSAALAGLAVTVACRNTVPEQMRILGEEDGFPTLPRLSQLLLRGPGSENEAGEALAQVIVDGFRQRRAGAPAVVPPIPVSRPIAW